LAIEARQYNPLSDNNLKTWPTSGLVEKARFQEHFNIGFIFECLIGCNLSSILQNRKNKQVIGALMTSNGLKMAVSLLRLMAAATSRH